ncbi:MAG: nodulation protein NfeD [Bacteroidetes bacterium]|nr:nodulation protein NfeD [Bacteroidota bacterium]MBU1718392.1 nodulation protein NfeD [Bacteroidota bacterium]
MKNIYFVLLAFLFEILSGFSSSAQQAEPKTEGQKRIYVFEIMDEIAPPLVRRTSKAFNEAVEQKADYILIHMNTYGGLLDAADSIRTRILNCPIPVIVFIDNNAASAGALISIACDSIYMRRGANIGAATVVDQTAQALPDKYQSYMRSMMRSTAEVTGRDPDIAQAMVDPVFKIEGIIDSGKVLTFTTSEAIQNGYCEGQAETIEEVLEVAGIENYVIIKQEITALDRIIGFLLSPAISGILIMIVIGGIYFELQTPGVGFPLVAAITAGALYFAPHYLDGLAENWEIMIFVAGLLLIGLEIFVIPGFGIAGISGIALAITGLSLSMIGNEGLKFSHVETTDIVQPFFIVFVATFSSLFLSFYFGKRLLVNTQMGSHIVLNTVEDKDNGYVASDNRTKALIGTQGKAFTMLRPGGKIEIGGVIYDAVADQGYIEKGETVIVTRHENMQLFVRKVI